MYLQEKKRIILRTIQCRKYIYQFNKYISIRDWEFPEIMLRSSTDLDWFCIQNELF